MRSISFLTSAFVFGFLALGLTSAPAQKPNPLAEQIRLQQTAVEQAPSSGPAWLKLATLQQDAAQYASSERSYHRAITLLRSASRAEQADALDHLATLYIEQGRLNRAQPLEEKALAIREDEKDSLGAGVSHMHLSALLLGRADFPAAEAEASMAVSLLAPAKPDAALTAATPEEQMTALIDLSLARCARQACVDAVPILQRARRIAQKHFSANSLPTGFTDFLLGYALWKSGDPSSAGPLMRTGSTELAAQLDWGHPTYLRALRQYRAYLDQTNQPAESARISAQLATLENKSNRASTASSSAASGLTFLP